MKRKLCAFFLLFVVVVNLYGWKLFSSSGRQHYTFRGVELRPGESISIHSGPDVSGIVGL